MKSKRASATPYRAMPFELTASETASVAEMKKKLGGFETEIGRLKGLDLVLSPTDVVITTSPKAGTTWVQQICHQVSDINCAKLD